MPVCNHPDWSDCAHEASRALLNLGIVDLRNKGTANCQVCHHPIRAHDIGKWASNYPSVTQCTQTNTYLVYQVRDVDGQGHVYVYSWGKNYGNGNYNWPQNNQKGGKIKTTIYKLK